jgi:hypothetical protein
LRGSEFASLRALRWSGSRELGAKAVPPGADPAQLLAPAAALRVARQVELPATVEVEVGRQIRRARGDRLFWHEIDALLDFAPLATDTRTGCRTLVRTVKLADVLQQRSRTLASGFRLAAART